MDNTFNGLKKPKAEVIGYSKSGKPLIKRVIPIIGSVATAESEERRRKADLKAEWRKQGKI